MDTLKPGDCLWCRIEASEPGGYLVTVISNGLKGFLPSTDPIQSGMVVPSTFVCMSGERALFTFAFTMGTSARVQHSTASDQENAFSVWTDAYPKGISLRRAIDVIMPAFSSSIMIKLDQQRAKEVFPTLEQTGFTGCIKVYCETSLSRAALILLNGRVVGSVYTKKPVPDPYTFELGIRKMLQDVSAPDAESELEMYELPPDIILSMSSLFQGYVAYQEKGTGRLDYAEKMLQHFSSCSDTACLNLLDEKTETPQALGFVCNGVFKGTYDIEERMFSEDKKFLLQVLEKHAEASFQVHILPAAMSSDAVRFGLSLSSEQFAVW